MSMAALVAHVSLFLIVEQSQLVPADAVAAWNTSVALFFLAVHGLYGNYAYWRRFLKIERQATSEGRDRDAQLRFLRARGGTGAFGATLLAVLFTAPALWAGISVSLYEDAGYSFDATGPLTLAEVEANLLSRMDLELSEERRACVIREIEQRARLAGDPETLDPRTVELLPETGWKGAGAFGRRLVLAQAISTKALFVCH